MGENVKPAKMPKKQPTLGDLFRGTVLDPWLEATRSRPLTDFTDVGECDICKKTVPITKLEQCESCALIVCDDCRPTHKH